MNIELYTVCWNEEHILPYFLDYYSTFCSKMIFYDNNSTDKSLEIIRSYPKTEIHSFDTNNELRDDINSHIKNTAWKNTNADYVIAVDCDEFVYVPNNPLDVFKKYHELGFDLITPNRAYNMVSLEFPKTKNIFKEITRANIGAAKPAIFNPKSIKEINYGPGAHHCRPIQRNKQIKYCISDDFTWLHYKTLGHEYLNFKYSKIKSRLSNINKQNDWGVGHITKLSSITKDEYIKEFINKSFEVIL